MDKEFVPFLELLLNRATGLRGTVSHIHVRSNEDDTITAKFSAQDSSIHYEIVTDKAMKVEWDALCLGNLSYLSQILSSNLMGKECVIETKMRDSGEKKVVLSLAFKPNDRTEFLYIATDPFASSVIKPVTLKLPQQWDAAALLDKKTTVELEEIRKIYSSSSLGGKENLLSLSLNGDKLVAETGIDTPHGTILQLDGEVYNQTKKKINLNLPFEQFLRALNASLGRGKETAVEIWENAVCITSDMEFGTDRTTIIGRKGKL